MSNAWGGMRGHQALAGHNVTSAVGFEGIKHAAGCRLQPAGDLRNIVCVNEP
jgi:hypothetical protein